MLNFYINRSFTLRVFLGIKPNYYLYDFIRNQYLDKTIETIYSIE